MWLARNFVLIFTSLLCLLLSLSIRATAVPMPARKSVEANPVDPKPVVPVLSLEKSKEKIKANGTAAQATSRSAQLVPNSKDLVSLEKSNPPEKVEVVGSVKPPPIAVALPVTSTLPTTPQVVKSIKAASHSKDVKAKVAEQKTKEKQDEGIPKGEENEDKTLEDPEENEEEKVLPAPNINSSVAVQPTPLKQPVQVQPVKSVEEQKSGHKSPEADKSGDKSKAEAEAKAKTEIERQNAENERRAQEFQASDLSQPSSHAFTYLIIFGALLSVVYLLVHNKNKILGLLLEGRSGRRPAASRRSPGGNVRYKRLSTSDNPATAVDVESDQRNYVS